MVRAGRADTQGLLQEASVARGERSAGMIARQVATAPQQVGHTGLMGRGGELTIRGPAVAHQHAVVVHAQDGRRLRGGASPPFGDAEVAMMSATTSATTGRRYGLERLCRTWERSRSALYARRARAQCRKRGAGPARRGPTPALSDAQLLAAIRSDLTRSPFQGEGHRKVHARLRILDGIRVSRTRVLRVMRAQGLLSPHRGRQGDPKAHDGTIVTSAPQVMWGTDGVRCFRHQVLVKRA